MNTYIMNIRQRRIFLERTFYTFVSFIFAFSLLNKIRVIFQTQIT